MHRSRVVKAFERTRKRAAEVVSTSTRRSRTSFRFWSRFSNAFSSSFFLREQERDELSRTTNGKERTSGETDTERSVRRRKEEPQNKFLESLRRETVKNLEDKQHVSDAKEEEDFKPPTRAFSLREKTFRETRGEERNRLLPKEINGPRGLEPTRFKDWEVGGRCTDF